MMRIEKILTGCRDYDIIHYVVIINEETAAICRTEKEAKEYLKEKQNEID